MIAEIFKGLSITFGNMFKKKNTFQYPEEKKPTAPRFHGRHQLNRHEDGLERCIGCELCAYACPADAIYVQGADNTPEARYSVGERYAAIYQINYNRCIFCGLCIEACPTRALTMSNEYELSVADRTQLVYDKEDLIVPVPAGAKAPPHADDVDGVPTIARYGPQASISQESANPVWALLKAQETNQPDEQPAEEKVGQ